MDHSPTLANLGLALAKAQADMKPALKDSTNPFFKSHYADLGSVWDAAREPLTTNGLSVVQLPGFENGVVTLTTVLLHESGEWIAGTAGAPIAKADAQSVGSCISYLRRYCLAAAVGITAEDDDGQAATQPKATKKADRRPEHVDEHGEIHDAPTQVNGVVFATASDTALAKLADWCEKEPQTRAKYLKAIHAEQKRRIASGMATGSNPGLVEPPAERLKAADHAAAGK